MASSLKRQRVDSFDTFMYGESAQNEEEAVVVGSRYSGREVVIEGLDPAWKVFNTFLCIYYIFIIIIYTYK